MTPAQLAQSELEAWAIHNALTAQRISKLERMNTGKTLHSIAFQTNSVTAPSPYSGHAIQGNE